MDETLADSEGDLASLHENVAKYRRLAQEHQEYGQERSAEKLLELVEILEARVAELAHKPSATQP